MRRMITLQDTWNRTPINAETSWMTIQNENGLQDVLLFNGEQLGNRSINAKWTPTIEDYDNCEVGVWKIDVKPNAQLRLKVKITPEFLDEFGGGTLIEFDHHSLNMRYDTIQKDASNGEPSLDVEKPGTYSIYILADAVGNMQYKVEQEGEPKQTGMIPSEVQKSIYASDFKKIEIPNITGMYHLFLGGFQPIDAIVLIIKRDTAGKNGWMDYYVLSGDLRYSSGYTSNPTPIIITASDESGQRKILLRHQTEDIHNIKVIKLI